MKYLRKFVLVLLWTIAGILMLNLLLVLLIQVPAVQNKVADFAIGMVRDKTGTVITLDEIAIRFPFGASLSGLYAETPAGDTLAYVGHVAISLQPLALFNSQLAITDANLANTVAYISRDADSTFNFDFLIEAFANPNADTTASAFDVSLNDLEVKNVRFYYEDALVPMRQEAQVGELALDFSEFSTLDQVIRAREIEISETRSITYIGKGETIEAAAGDSVEAPANIGWELFPGELFLADVSVKVMVEGTMELNATVGDAAFVSDVFELDSQQVHLSSLALSMVDYDMRTFPEAQAETTDTAVANVGMPQTGWDIRVGEIAIEQVTFGMDEGTVEMKGHFDPRHIHLAVHKLFGEGLVFSDKEIALQLGRLDVYSTGDWFARNVSGNLLWNAEVASVEDFVFETPYSNGQVSMEIAYEDFTRFIEDPQKADVSAYVDIPRANVKDAWYFVPAIDTNAWFRELKEQNISIVASAEGNTDELLIDELLVTDNDLVTVNISGQARNVLDPESMNGNIQIHNLFVRSGLAQAFIPDTAMPQNMVLPAFVRMNGSIKGGLQDLSANLHGEIDSGSFDLKGDFAYRDSVNTTYDLEFQANDIALGYYLQNDSLGRADIVAAVEGKGFAQNNRSARGFAMLPEFGFMQYEYDTIRVDATLENEVLSVVSSYSDSNLIYDLDGQMAIGVESPFYKVELDVGGIDFQALHMVEYDARYTAKIMADIVIDADNDILGDLSVTELGVVRKGREAFIDSFIVASIKDTGNYSMNVRSDLMTIDYEGNVSLTELPAVIKAQVNEYYQSRDTTSTVNLAEKHFDFNVQFKRTEILNGLLIPGLTEYEPGSITGKLNGAQSNLQVHMALPHLKYLKFSLDTFVIDVKSDQNEMVASVYADKLAYDTLPVNNLDVTAVLANNELEAFFQTGTVADSTDTADYYFAVHGERLPEGFTLSTPEHRAVLNGETWDIAPDNIIVKTAYGWETRNFVLTHGNSRAEVIVDREPEGDKLMLELKNFTLSSVSGIVQTDTVLVEGFVDGQLQLDSLKGDLSITNLVAMGNPAGDMDIQFEKDYATSAFNTDIAWTGEGNHVNIAGMFNATAPVEQMDLSVELAPLNLHYVEGFTLNNLRDVEGVLRGSVSVKGSFAAPAINGSLTFSGAEFIVATTGTRYFMRDEVVKAVDGDLQFTDFSVYDSAGQRMVLNGEIRNEDYTRFDLELDLKADNFSILHAPVVKGAPISGSMVVDADVKVRGRLGQPDISGTVRVEEGTEVTFVVPQQELKVASYEGTVEFYDQDIERNPILGREKTGIDTGAFEFLGLNTTMELHIDPNAAVRIVIDEVSGDHLYVQGGGQLGLSMDAYGNMTLTGTYLIQDGYYKLNFYDLVKKEFVIVPGSSLQWHGNATEALVNIQAMYTTRADPSNLFIGPAASEVSGGRVPVNVELNMRGELLQPELDFDISISEDDEGAYGGRVKSRLAELNQNESELNKQVFGLLVLNSFLPEESGGGPDGTSIARASASKILSNQLNKLGDEYLQGVELDVTVDSYESGATESGATDLELALSKRFLDNRLEVQVGGDVALEGERTQEQQPSRYLGDVEITYKLTEDGRLKLQAFRDNEFDDLIAGEIIETGVGLLYTRHYNKLRELFRKPEDTTANTEQADLSPADTNKEVE